MTRGGIYSKTALGNVLLTAFTYAIFPCFDLP